MPHLFFPDDWVDGLRIVAFFVCLYSTVLLVIRRNRTGKDWNVKTNDYWFALLMWSASGLVFCLQGIVLNRPLSPATAFMLAAILATGKAVHGKGKWGSDAA